MQIKAIHLNLNSLSFRPDRRYSGQGDRQREERLQRRVPSGRGRHPHDPCRVQRRRRRRHAILLQGKPFFVTLQN